jgi:quercetin dioxygenase-like cupin family protein
LYIRIRRAATPGRTARVIPHRAITSVSNQDIPKEGGHKMALKIPLSALTVAVVLAPAAHAAPPPENSDQNPVVRPVFNQTTNVPGKSLEAVAVTYPPGAKSEAHHHARSAFIMAYVISGAIRSQVEGEPARVYQAGETWDAIIEHLSERHSSGRSSPNWCKPPPWPSSLRSQ